MFKTIPKVNFKDYFQVIEEKKSGYYPFNLQLKETKRLNGGQSKGIYAIFFKDKLVYIGLHHGKGNVVDRWEKHIKSFTSRFLPLNFLSADKTKYPNKKNSEFTKFYKNLTFNKLIDYYLKIINKNDNQKMIIEKILSDHIQLKKNEFRNKYKNPFEPFVKKAYDLYLKKNNQSFGIKSYGLVVNLLIYDYQSKIRLSSSPSSWFLSLLNSKLNSFNMLSNSVIKDLALSKLDICIEVGP